ncbi:transcriptional regulator, y4mF family [Shuttleworthella sp. MSX8B]|uniref:helix-turn-helix transcriptional regulator n=1 Tax=Shuttleworthella sp. MSX8B TaxID=936574 RepID=UPI00045100F4|nr:helix-turn-helix transcriptional regulator [Shuttleworthia sp. MSX8B]EUB12947.1 transcriptional regulator, y4mF family [Shuttleworthia sp. MSX8B]
MSRIGDYVKENRRRLGITQEEFAVRSGLGLRFVRELEQGKKTVRMDKVNQALQMFGMEAVPGPISQTHEASSVGSVPSAKKDKKTEKPSSLPDRSEEEEDIWLL